MFEKKPLYVEAQRLRELREERGLSRQEVADKVGIGLREYVRYETLPWTEVVKPEPKGRRSEPSIGTLLRLSKLFRVSEWFLLGLTDDPHDYNPNLQPDDIVAVQAHKAKDRQAFLRAVKKRAE